MSNVIKQNARAGVVWEQGDDGRHRVTAGDEVLVETRVESLAQLTYDDAVVERDPARKMRERERARHGHRLAVSHVHRRKRAAVEENLRRPGAVWSEPRRPCVFRSAILSARG